MAEKNRDFWNEKMETISQEELHQLHEEKLVTQVKYKRKRGAPISCF